MVRPRPLVGIGAFRVDRISVTSTMEGVCSGVPAYDGDSSAMPSDFYPVRVILARERERGASSRRGRWRSSSKSDVSLACDSVRSPVGAATAFVPKQLPDGEAARGVR